MTISGPATSVQESTGSGSEQAPDDTNMVVQANRTTTSGPPSNKPIVLPGSGPPGGGPGGGPPGMTPEVKKALMSVEPFVYDVLDKAVRPLLKSFIKAMLGAMVLMLIPIWIAMSFFWGSLFSMPST